MSRVKLAGFVILFLIACQTGSGELTEEHRVALADSVTALSATMQAAFDNEDPAYFDYFSDWTTMSAAGSRAHSQNRTRTMGSYWRTDDQTSESEKPRTLVLGPDAVVVERAQVNTVTDSTGVTTSYDALLRELWVREAAGWKAVVYHFQSLGVR